MLKRFIYRGPVSEYGRCVCAEFYAETMAENSQKALSNVGYQFKKKYNLQPFVKIVLEATKLHETK